MWYAIFFYLKILAIWHNLWKQLNSEMEIIIFRHKLAGPPWTMAMHSSWTQGWFCLCGSARKLAVQRESRLEIVGIFLRKNIIGIKVKRLWYSSFIRSCRIMLNFFSGAGTCPSVERWERKSQYCCSRGWTRERNDKRRIWGKIIANLTFIKDKCIRRYINPNTCTCIFNP